MNFFVVDLSTVHSVVVEKCPFPGLSVFDHFWIRGRPFKNHGPILSVLKYRGCFLAEFTTLGHIQVLNLKSIFNLLHTTEGPRIVRIQTVRFHYSAINFLVKRGSIL